MSEPAEILILEILRRMESDIQEMKADVKLVKAGLIEALTHLIVIKRQRTL
jgi:hypothetical protein